MQSDKHAEALIAVASHAGFSTVSSRNAARLLIAFLQRVCSMQVRMEKDADLCLCLSLIPVPCRFHCCAPKSFLFLCSISLYSPPLDPPFCWRCVCMSVTCVWMRRCLRFCTCGHTARMLKDMLRAARSFHWYITDPKGEALRTEIVEACFRCIEQASLNTQDMGLSGVILLAHNFFFFCQPFSEWIPVDSILTLM